MAIMKREISSREEGPNPQRERSSASEKVSSVVAKGAWRRIGGRYALSFRDITDTSVTSQIVSKNTPYILSEQKEVHAAAGNDVGRDERVSLKMLQPLKVVNNFDYSASSNNFTPPFATESEYYSFLSGREGTVLCTRKEPICSKDFVQCSGALVRNKRTGLLSLIHQSMWSTAAETILAVQRPDDLDIILIDSPTGRAMGREVIWSHGLEARNYRQEFSEIDRTDPLSYKDPQTRDLKHTLVDYSHIRGVSTAEMMEMFERGEEKETAGSTSFLGEIKLPGTLDEIGRMSLLYRPAENVVWIYSEGKKQLFKYPGFPL